MDLFLLSLSVSLAALVSFAATPLSSRVARAVGAVDLPDGARKRHPRATARLGGLALLLGLLASASALWHAAERGTLVSLLPSALLVCAAGVCDDSLSLPPRAKLACQLAAATVSVALAAPPRGAVASVVSVVFICALTNAFNFIDGSDGLAAGQGAVSGALLAALLLTASAPTAAACAALVLSAACLGFLPHNRYRASAFLGDTGSMLIGHSLAVLSLQCAPRHLPTVALGAFALPLADLLFAILRRARRGCSLFCADRGHIHHRMADAGRSPREIALILCFVSFLIGCISIIAVAAA